MIELIKFDNSIEEVINPSQELIKAAEGFEFIEGPIWNSKCEHLTFNDIVASKTYRWSEKEGLRTIRENTNKANGNAYDNEGRIIVCEHAKSRLARTKIDGGDYEVLVSHYQGKELNSPNDVVVKSDGSIYFTDPRFGRNPSRVGVPREQELPFQGVFRYEPESGELTLLADDFGNPNGLCFSLDEKQLFVNDSPKSHIRVFDVKEDGTLENSRIWAVTEGEGSGVPDGLKIDSRGNIYCCAQGGLHIFNENGKYLGIIRIPEQAANFAWGDKDLCSIYITASSKLYKIKVNVPGIRKNI